MGINGWTEGTLYRCEFPLAPRPPEFPNMTRIPQRPGEARGAEPAVTSCRDRPISACRRRNPPSPTRGPSNAGAATRQHPDDRVRARLLRACRLPSGLRGSAARLGTKNTGWPAPPLAYMGAVPPVPSARPGLGRWADGGLLGRSIWGQQIEGRPYADGWPNRIRGEQSVACVSPPRPARTLRQFRKLGLAPARLGLDCGLRSDRRRPVGCEPGAEH